MLGRRERGRLLGRRERPPLLPEPRARGRLQNVMQGLVRVTSWDRLAALAADPAVVILDVRSDTEFKTQVSRAHAPPC